MKRAIIILILSVSVSILSLAVSQIAYLNLVWIMAAALFITENDNFALPFCLISGFLFDILMHLSVGTTSICLLLGVIFYTGFKIIFSSDSFYYKFFSAILFLFVTFASKAIADVVIEGRTYSSVLDFFYWIRYFPFHLVILWLTVLLINWIGATFVGERKIKLK